LLNQKQLIIILVKSTIYQTISKSVSNELSYFQNNILLKRIPGDEQVVRIKESKEKMVRTANFEEYGIDLLVDYQPSSNPQGGDHRSFFEAGVPVIRFKPGHREEYH